MLTGSYDGISRVWEEGKMIGALSGHQAPVKSVTCFDSAGGRCAASASKDHTLRLFKFDEQMGATGATLCVGHTASVEAVASSPNGNLLCSGSWDRTIRLWDTNTGIAVAKPPKKKTKKSSADVESVESIATLEGHSDAVTALEWLDGDCIVTGSWDHTLRAWDARAQSCIRVLNGSKAFRAISWSAAANLLAAVQGDKTIGLWDIKGEGHTKVRLGVGSEGHQAQVVDVAWVPGSSSLLCSASHDCTTRLWDTRSTKIPLHTLTTHDDKALCVYWIGDKTVLTGGADCKMREASLC